VTQTREEIREYYQLLFASITDAVVIADLETFQIIDCNEASERLYGYTREEMLERKLTDFSAEPDLTLKFLHALEKGGDTHLSLRYHRHRDGTLLPVEITSGQFVSTRRRYVYGVCRDLRERLRVETELRNYAARLKALHDIDRAILESRPID
jgi:PAS domain S-box-containing protein